MLCVANFIWVPNVFNLFKKINIDLFKIALNLLFEVKKS